MTVCTAASVSRAADVSIRNSDSGVVIRMSGGLAISSRRRPGGVSPERTPTLMSGAGSPRRSAMRPMPVSGVRRLRSTSTASAFSGDTYSTRVPAPAGRGSVAAASSSIAHRNAASVLPDPVGAMTSVLSPSAMADQACACASVGAAKVPVNHSLVSALNRASGSTWVEPIQPSCQPPPTNFSRRLRFA